MKGVILETWGRGQLVCKNKGSEMMLMTLGACSLPLDGLGAA